jgi:phosphoribosylaminoimidazole-succinocarboxamide synthase
MVVYSGKAKDVIEIDEDRVKIVFRDSISAFDGIKKEELTDKGRINCLTSTKLFEILNEYGFETHFIKKISDTELICKRVEILPVEVVCRNYSAGSLCKRYGLEKGIKFDIPLIEFFVKDDELHDPLIASDVAINLQMIERKEAILLEAITRAVNEALRKIFESISLVLVDFKLEFGKTVDGRIVIADEISADTMRLWEKESGEIKDKDRYRQDLGDVIIHYKDIQERLEQIKSLPPLDLKSSVRVIIKLKDSVLDPAGEVTLRSLKRKEFKNIEDVRLGKSSFLLFSETPSFALQEKIEKISRDILSNPLIENHSYEIHFGSDKLQV